MMKTQATYDDANLILKLYDLRREDRLREARRWMVTAPQFTSREHWLEYCPPGTEENANYRMVTTYWEMASSFVANGVLNAELFYTSNNTEMLLVWEKVRKLIPILREQNKNPLQLRSMETVAKGFTEFLNREAPGFLEQWTANLVKGTAAPAKK
jgi:hypothetical protein